MGARALDDVDAATRGGEVHVFAVAHLDVNPVHAAGFEFLNLRAEHAIVRPEETGRDF